MNQGTYYIAMVADANGLGSGGSSEIQAVQNSQRTACLNTASQNQTANEFTFDVAGQAKQCFEGLEVAWTGDSSGAPYNFTIVPLDQSFYAFDVAAEGGRSYINDWQMNLTMGQRFTVMMK